LTPRKLREPHVTGQVDPQVSDLREKPKVKRGWSLSDEIRTYGVATHLEQGQTT